MRAQILVCGLVCACGRIGFDATGQPVASDAVPRDARDAPDAPLAVWPDEPVGFTPITDQPWDMLASLGWSHNPCASTIVADPTAPRSPANVLEHPFPAGFGGDSTSCIDFFTLPTPHDELFAGIWWRASDPWQGAGDGTNGIAALSMPTGSVDLVMQGTGAGPFTLLVEPSLGADNSALTGPGVYLPANAGDGTVQLGAWHRLELYVRASTTSTSRDGVVRWWLDGHPVGGYDTVNFAEMPFIEYDMKSYWGPGATKTEDDDLRFDQSYLSAP